MTHGGAAQDVRRIAVAALVGGACLAGAFFVGVRSNMAWETLPLIATGLVWEAQPAAAASLALGFPPWAGALISLCANAAPLPLLLVALPAILARWSWARARLERAQARMRRYLRWGPWALVLVAPWLGTYLTLSLGISMGLPWRRALAAVLASMTASVALIVFGVTAILASLRW